MVFTPKGKHFVAGEWLDGAGTFASSPAHGPSHEFAVGTVELVNRACEAAEEAFWTYGNASRKDRAAFLRAIADEIEARAEAITEIGTQETGLPVARLQGERGQRGDDYSDALHGELVSGHQSVVSRQFGSGVICVQS